MENPALKGREANYVSISVDSPKVLSSWRESLFSFEWLHPDGRIKKPAELSETERAKRETVEKKLSSNQPIEKPVLGIGIMDNVEIGIGRAEFLTLAANGIRKIDVHIPKSNQGDFKPFLAGVD
jgi:hypothetical protein